ncbi:KpsF/GutQ family sugar-phosphate isomerase [Salinibius halmophilus]|uniref:KpsF/GutQ family sugar-phosphate isomerase n=1 Tax=Salinibius halmophilus TaxID=1853216 RepID=UPI000E66FD83|nr:KpsF/GutQ family sugar-phosphate isomerase [Salinibius halmophilus]
MSDFIQSAKQSISKQTAAIESLLPQLDDNFTKACQLCLACTGRVVVTGMGKSGHIGNKIAATLASTGTPAFFVHPGEASHGDLGMIQPNDVVIALSDSGETGELVSIIPLLKRMNVPMISITRKSSCTLAENANAALATGISEEACPLNLAPTSSTTASLVLGDALAIALLEARGFTAEDFAFSHPGGSLGRKLLTRVRDLMHQGDELPVVDINMKAPQALSSMSQKRFGITGVVDAEGKLVGVFTVGDLLRVVEKGTDIAAVNIGDIMTPGGQTISPDALAVEALKQMEGKITALFVCLGDKKPVGIIHLHDVLQAGIG